MWIRLAALLLCINVALPAPQDVKLRPLTSANCWCNFDKMAAELRDLNKPDSNHAEQVFSFVNTLISLNFKLNLYFTDFRQCIRFWLNNVRQCEASCSCAKDTVCCRDTSFGSLDKGVLTLKNQVKHTFTAYSHIQFLNDYHQSTFDVQNVYSSAFIEFLGALKMDKSRADNEGLHFLTFYKRMEQKKPLDSIFAITMPGENSTRSIITKVAEHYQCDTTKVLPFYLNVYGVVMQFLLMRELQAELQASKDHETKSQFSNEIEWKPFLRLTDNMTKQIVLCSGKEIYAIRSQEIKEKDMAMRNAAVVFSCFLLALVIVIAIIAFFACKSKERAAVTVREEPMERSVRPKGHNPLLKQRYYETDDTI